jgi:hypothetical protein
LKGKLDSGHVQVMQAFYYKSYFFKQLLNFQAVLHTASDLSQLWYREYVSFVAVAHLFCDFVIL